MVVPMFIQVAYNRPLVHAFLFLLDCNIPLLAVYFINHVNKKKKKGIMQVYLFEASVVEIYFLTSPVFTAWTPLDNENL